MPLQGENPMTRLPKDRRDKLILTIVGTALIVAGLYFGLISFQRTQIQSLEAKKEQDKKKANDVEESIRNAKKIQGELEQKTTELSNAESDMASGDAYLWMVNLIRQFKTSYNVDISQFSAISKPEVGLYPKFAYSQVAINVGGSAYYHELGRFIADFENQFPHIRIHQLTLEPPGVPSGDRDKLNFRMEVVALMKPGVQ
jgi:Tfp pilus assembly protein PilO